jgi:hypothetical protein
LAELGGTDAHGEFDADDAILLRVDPAGSDPVLTAADFSPTASLVLPGAARGCSASSTYRTTTTIKETVS